MKTQIVTLVCAGVASASFLLGVAYGQSIMRKEAVIGGFAEYLPDSMGNPKFTWK
jgi:hypothetical protein